jgi:hypothetical protein
MCEKVLPYMPVFQPYRGKLAERNDREGRGNVGIIRSPIRASTLPDCGGPLSDGRPYRYAPECPLPAEEADISPNGADSRFDPERTMGAAFCRDAATVAGASKCTVRARGLTVRSSPRGMRVVRISAAMR